MSSLIRKVIPLGACLVVLVAPPAFAAKQGYGSETRYNNLIASNFVRQPLPSSSFGRGSSPYIGSWKQGYPRPHRW
jgi:hypothetical protein